MPIYTVRTAAEVPSPSKMDSKSKAIHEMYESYLNEIPGPSDVGDLELQEGDSDRGVKVRLRNASKRLGLDVQIWGADGHVYVRRIVKRGRPRAVGENGG